tara:strand:- start:4657 stop:5250 length:594 start_codon:yes stop_codon:yes gene_type:complete
MLTDKEKFISILSNSVIKQSNAIVLLEGDGVYRVKNACNLYNKGYSDYFVFSGNADNPGYGSYPLNKLKDEFNKHIDFNIKEIIHEDTSLHTKEQAYEIIQLALKNQWNKLILVASNFHQYRAFLTFVQELYDNNLEKSIKIYNAPCILPWFKSLNWGTRHKLLEQEFKKIEQYQLKQDVCSYKNGLKYLQWVEQQV